jgi:hypothetical protein
VLPAASAVGLRRYCWWPLQPSLELLHYCWWAPQPDSESAALLLVGAAAKPGAAS